jgi:hypothetical protein
MFEPGGGGSYAAPAGPAPPRSSELAKITTAFKRKEETGRGMERGVYTAEELAVVEAESASDGGWTAAEFADVPLRVGWRLVTRTKPGVVKPTLQRRTVWTVQGTDGSAGEDLYSARAARDWAATYRVAHPPPPSPHSPPQAAVPPTAPLRDPAAVALADAFNVRAVPNRKQWNVSRKRKGQDAQDENNPVGWPYRL